MTDEALAELAADIKANGLHEPITLTPDGLLLDGRCRTLACEMVGIDPTTTVYDGPPVPYSLSKNKHRRHVDKSQMAMSVGRLDRLQNGTNQHRRKVGSLLETTLSVEELSKQSNVGSAYIKYARTLLQQGEPHIVAMVDSGKVNVRVAAEAVRVTERSIQASWTQDDVKREGYKVIRAYPSNQRVAASARKRSNREANDEQPRTIHVPYGKALANFPTEEESPRDRIRQEKGYEGVVEHQLRYGRTPLCPDRVKDMMICDGMTATLTAPIRLLGSPQAGDVEQFFDAIDQMLTWVPVPGKTNGMERDFAKKARATLAELQKTLPAAVERLTALLDALRARSADKARVQSHPEHDTVQ
jgi:hypothetical protein